MDNDTHEADAGPVPETGDALTEVLRRGARDLLKQAVEAEFRAFLDDNAGHTLDDGVRESTQAGTSC